MNEEKKDGTGIEEEEEEFVEKVDPVTLKPDLYAAAEANDTAKVEGFLDQGVPPTFVESESGLTALHWAAMNGNVKMIAMLLANGASEPYHRLKAKAEKEKSSGAESGKPSLGLGAVSREVDDEEDEDDETGANEQVGYNNGSEDNSLAEENEAEQEDAEKELEVSVNLLKNTPLLWATYKGYLDVIWHLLKDGYSPNDTDKMDNNGLHLAAAYGNTKVLKVLIDDGGNANVVNHYKNLPVAMSKTKEVRDMLAVAMEQGASMTEKDIAEKHVKNMEWYERISADLVSAVREASRINTPGALKDITAADAAALIDQLSSATAVGTEWCLDADLVAEGEKLLLKLELSRELAADIKAVQALCPVQSQTVYLDGVTRLERSLERAHAANIDKAQLDVGLDLVLRCQAEYWLSVLLERLKDVVAADDSNEHDMNQLRKAVDKAEKLHADAELSRTASKFLGRLGAELGMTRAIKLLPQYKLPPPDGVIPEGYWGEQDAGHIQETEGYPLPPADTGEYVWQPSEAFSALSRAIDALKSSYVGAEELGANPDIIAEAQEKLAKAEKDFKVLEAKDAEDRARAVEAAKKAAKKLKGGKGKKKKG